jgi:hypothetical protein
MGEHFDPDELQLLNEADEIEIETHATESQESHRATIWLVTVGPEAYVRSTNGTEGLWYRQLTANGAGAIYAENKRIPVRATRVSDAEVLREVSDAYLRKYAPYLHDVAWLVLPEIAETTLRLEPSRGRHETRSAQHKR